ncbi:DUF5331 domain-containing protein [Umezakia ovalisporum]|uniref:DUF5331 domain-containing protein n=2 Tax=Umezakia ovalisporum TaxID=75695 RepID=A0AA43GVT6_9CYAN|nr:DUF5331 domain-containing protein [Umezakia ovalisporum]MBI1241726.1 hypothetical protein [Nostoc sp. RI_552]MDH6056583.1 DUF5331 domain-containing protein [Umezakia ovalisporum FSS-43]MDH6062326.1 DUF5331 domain-containing protein [Umezakia ovalisporum FSS-62]MDH6067923.1 DUF5331 domain-containing protein [Umezakia ovalisporum APH033B]MDH6069243.1 DUF5331 domain-containing protein [Umezakia ovalisporum CobakiLakeA]
MAFFNSFTNSIRQKWLQFFQVNRDWLILHMKADSVNTPDGGKRPPSYLILGVVNALEPKLAQLMMPFSRLNSDVDTLIEVLDLHFDPDIALGNRFIPPDETEEIPAAGEINQYQSADENSALESSVVSESDESQNQLGNEFNEPLNAEADDFGEISFDSSTVSVEKLNEEMLDDLNTPDDNALKEVSSDVWDDTALSKSGENIDFLGEELPSGVFDESEIARLFPKA